MTTDDAPVFAAFDYTAIYQAEIEPLLDQLIAISRQHQIPILVVVGIQGRPEGVLLSTTMLPYDRRTPEALTLAARLILGKDVPDEETNATSSPAGPSATI